MKVFEYMDGLLKHTWSSEEEVMQRYSLSKREFEMACTWKVTGVQREFVLCDNSLDMMFRMQAMLEYRVKVLPVESEEARTQLLVNHAQYLDQELHEMLRELRNFKPWKKYDWCDREAEWRKDLAKDEAVDAFHFMLNVLLLLEVTPEELADRYIKKNTKNHARQDSNY